MTELDVRMGHRLRVLLVDDEPAVLHALQVLMDVHGFPHVCARTPDEALAAIDDGEVGLAIQDMNFTTNETSGDQGVALFRAMRERDPDLPVLLITAWASLESAVQLIKEGAADYLSKPWDDDKLIASVRNLMRLRRLQLENDVLRERGRRDRETLRQRHDLCGVVYESAEMHRAVGLAIDVAPSDAPVLVCGPSGSGKEKIAEIVQANSRRRDGPFVRVNVGALPADLLESELFGAEAGAYTGATGRRIGRFEAADGGTLFLDEIDALPLAGQVKLLRVLQTGEFQRLGSSRTLRSDVRVVSGTNADLAASIAAGRFREDLYYRLNVIEIPLAPLASRPEDILPLARHFLGPDSPRELARDAELALLRHDWPGNVRELQNRIERVRLTASGDRITAVDLDLDAAGGERPGGTRPEDDALAHAVMSGPLASEKRRIEHALHDSGGVVSRAADALGLSRQALYRRMDRLGISVERRLRS